MNNVMENVENHYQKITKNINYVRNWHAVVWTGTSRISRYQFMDEFGEKFTDFEFSKKIGSKDSVRNILRKINLRSDMGLQFYFKLNKANYEYWRRISGFCSNDKKF